MEYTAVVMIIEKIILISLVFFVIFSEYGLIELGYVYVFVGIVDVLLSFSVVLIKIAKPKPTINFPLWKTLIIGSIPFGLNALFGVLFFKIDTVMLSVFKDDAAVGIYNAAYVTACNNWYRLNHGHIRPLSRDVKIFRIFKGISRDIHKVVL